MTSQAPPPSGVFPGLRKLTPEVQAAVIETLYDKGFFGSGQTLEEVLIAYMPAPLLTKRLRCVMPEMTRMEAGMCEWPMKDVTFWHDMSLGGLTKEQVKQAYEEACYSWNAVCGIKLVMAVSGQHINISAQDGHIDGSSGTLAYSYLPCNANQGSTMAQMYDDSEHWTYPWFQEVAAHEVGHAIGLDHSPDPNALMYPYSHGGAVPKPQEWDIEQVVARYGLPVDPPDPPEPPPGGDGTGVVVIEGITHMLRLKPEGSGPGLGGGMFVLGGETYELVVLT